MGSCLQNALSQLGSLVVAVHERPLAGVHLALHDRARQLILDPCTCVHLGRLAAPGHRHAEVCAACTTDTAADATLEAETSNYICNNCLCTSYMFQACCSAEDILLNDASVLSSAPRSPVHNALVQLDVKRVQPCEYAGCEHY